MDDREPIVAPRDASRELAGSGADGDGPIVEEAVEARPVAPDADSGLIPAGTDGAALVPAGADGAALLPAGADGAALVPAGADGAAVIAADGGAAIRSRRRKYAILALLALAAALLTIFSAWYLITRKPISAFPLPGLTVEATPHYEFSVYGVTAPTGVAVSADGSRIYVTQTEGDPEVLIFDGKGTKIGEARPPATTGKDHVPVYLAIQPANGDLYASDRPTGSIYVFSSDGAFLRTFEPGKSLAGWQPLGLAFDAHGDLYVTDVSGPFNTIHEFDADGALVRTIGEPGEFNFPNGVATDASGNLYVTDSNNGRLVVLDPAGKQRAVIRRGPGSGDLGLPRGTAIDDSGRVYVVDTSGQGVQLYHVIGDQNDPPAYIGRFGTQGTEDGAFQYPNGVAVDGRARVYVTDWRNNRVQVWTY